MDSNGFLDAVCRRHRIDSNRALARFLDIDRTRVTAYRQGRRTLDGAACIAVGKALDLPPEHVLASVQAERAAKRPKERRYWLAAARKLKAVSVAGPLVSAGFLGALGSPVADAAVRTGCILW